jgi:hypothetical protein
MTVRYSHLTPKHTLAAVERLTGAASTTPTDTKTSTAASEEQIPLNRRMSTDSFRCSIL